MELRRSKISSLKGEPFYLPGNWLSLFLVTSLLFSAPVSAASLGAPTVVNLKNETLQAISAKQMATEKSIFIKVEDIVSATPDISSWTIYILDLSSREIVWSRNGKGRPAGKIEWNGLTDAGAMPKPGVTLAIKLTVDTKSGPVSSQILELPVIAGDGLWKAIDRGLHLTPTAAIGVGQLTIKDNLGLNESVTLMPMVITDLSFHADKTHFFGARLESAARVIEKGSGATYAYNELYYRWKAYANGGFSLRTGLEIFFAKISSTYPPNADAGSTHSRFYLNTLGLGLLIDLSYQFNDDVLFDFFLNQSMGFGKYSGTITSAEVGIRFPFTSAIGIEPTIGYAAFAKTSTLNTGSGNTSQELTITNMFARLILSLSI